jgi:asparagine synthetase B (glutamine-hydrolysing)
VNRILGVVSEPDASDRVRGAIDWLTSRGQEAPEIAASTEAATFASIGDGGAVLGFARAEGVTLLMLGWVHAPAPGWEDGSPVDLPDATAAYLLDRYRREGLSFLDELSGSFVVALLDENSGRVLLARDPSGGRRLFIARTAEGLLFSSQLADMRGLLGSALRVDRGLENFHLAYEFLPWNRTVFEGVSILEQGTILEASATDLTETPIEAPKPRAGTLLDFGDGAVDEDAVIEKMAEVFTQAVEDQAPSGDRVAVLLGGFDSALVASVLSRMGKTVETFSFHYEDESYNQAHTDELSRLLGVQHNWVPITSESIQHGLESYAHGFNQPVSQSHYMLNTARACEMIRERGFDHALTGDGCDGLFLGYPTVHTRAKLIMRLASMSALLRPLDLVAGSEFLERRLGQPYRVARNVLRILRREMPARAHVASCALDEASLSFLRRDPAPAEDEPTEEILSALANPHANKAEVRLAYLGKGAVGLNRNKLEGSSTLTGVSLMSPFMHPSMIAFAASLPDELSRPDHATKAEATGKYALMAMAERKALLPNELIYQKKMSPVTAPVDVWYTGVLREFMLSRLSGLPF